MVGLLVARLGYEAFVHDRAARALLPYEAQPAAVDIFFLRGAGGGEG